MKLDLEWLLEHLDGGPPAPDRLADALTACGLLVELRESLGGTEVWDVDITTNRPDAMNHRGLAREAAVATGAGLVALDTQVDETDEDVTAFAAVDIAAPELCSRYVARVVRGIRLGASPAWLAARLERCGVRPINSIVDVTNFVLLALGQPLHAFDLARLSEHRIVVRRAMPGERLTTLDGVVRELTDDTLVIADARGAVALAGIMGGEDSVIGPGTVDVLIESAHFEPLSIRRTARRLGMHTEASHRFERGCDPLMAASACDLAATMIAKLAGGRVCRGRLDVFPRPPEPRTVAFDVDQLNAFAGLVIPGDRAVAILGGLGFAPERAGTTITCTVPSFRVDVDRPADLFEEVIRHVGYDAIPATLPVLSSTPGRRHPNWELVDRGRAAAVGAGLTEVITYAFIDPAADALTGSLPCVNGAPLPLANPLASTQATMRRSLLPGLVTAARDALNQGEPGLAIFEVGRAFWLHDDGTPGEAERLGVVIAGVASDRGEPVDFLDLKGALEVVLQRSALPAVSWRRGGGPWLEEGQGALLVAEDGRTLGLAGRLSAELVERWDVRQPLWVGELDLSMAAPESELPRYSALARFPAVVADVTVEHDTSLSYAELVATIRTLASTRVERIELAARYRGSDLPGDRIRTTLRLVYRDSERSLTQDEVNASQDALRAALAERLAVRLA